MKSIVTKIVAKGQGDATRSSTLAQLLQPRITRSLPREVEEWLLSHDLVGMLDGLASHLLRTLPTDMHEETDKWIDSQKISTGSVVAINKPEDVAVAEVVCDDDVTLVERGSWQGRDVLVVSIKKTATRSLRGAAARAQHHRVACVTATAPLLPKLHHDHLVPVFGYFFNDRQVSLIMHRGGPSLREVLSSRVASRRIMTLREVAAIGLHVVDALAHLHALGFLHRNVTLDGVLTDPQRPGVFMLGGFDFTVRTSRGRVTSQAWIPPLAAPETLQNRVFEAATDVYGFAAFLLSVACYGDGVRGIPSERPHHIPAQLWSEVLAPSFARSSYDRPTCSQLAESLRQMINSPEEQYIPHVAADGVDSTAPTEPHTTSASPADPEAGSARGCVSSEALSALINAGAPADTHTATDVTITRLVGGAASWARVQDGLSRNAALTALRLESVQIPGDGGDTTTTTTTTTTPPLLVHPSARLQTLSLAAVALDSARLLRFLESVCATQPHVTRFSIEQLELGDAVVAELMSCITVAWPLLEQLTLRALRLSTRALQTISDIMCGERRLRHLRVLDLGAQELAFNGVSRLCAWLQRDAQLERISFSGGRLDYYGVGSLAQVLRQNDALRELDLRGVPLSPPALRLLLTALREQQTHAARAEKPCVLKLDASSVRKGGATALNLPRVQLLFEGDDVVSACNSGQPQDDTRIGA